MTTGWKLEAEQRNELLSLFVPIWPDVVADHVTLQYRPDPDDTPLPPEVVGEIVGLVDDGKGLQTLVVRINGTTRRPDGSFFHITWSIHRAVGREEVHSNEVLRQLGWQPIAAPILIQLVPARYDHAQSQWY